jgi:hypothetical protein
MWLISVQTVKGGILQMTAVTREAARDVKRAIEQHGISAGRLRLVDREQIRCVWVQKSVR